MEQFESKLNQMLHAFKSSVTMRREKDGSIVVENDNLVPKLIILNYEDKQKLARHISEKIYLLAPLNDYQGIRLISSHELERNEIIII